MDDRIGVYQANEVSGCSGFALRELKKIGFAFLDFRSVDTRLAPGPQDRVGSHVDRIGGQGDQRRIAARMLADVDDDLRFVRRDVGEPISQADRVVQVSARAVELDQDQVGFLIVDRIVDRSQRTIDHSSMKDPAEFQINRLARERKQRLLLDRASEFQSNRQKLALVDYT